MGPISVVWVGLMVIAFCLPTTPAGVPWNDDFSTSSFNYAVVVTGGVFLVAGLWWVVSAKNTFTGPKHSLTEIDAEIGAPPPFPEAP
jgi:hypothetical protein